jgi:hypothetical protein
MAVEIVDFRPYQKNTLQGFLTVRMTGVGLEIKDIALHRRDGNEWLQLPAKPYQKPDGSQGWSYILSFYNKETFKKFQQVTLEALESFRGQAGGNNDGSKS